MLETGSGHGRWRLLLTFLLALALVGLVLAAVRAGSPSDPPPVLRLRAGVFDPLQDPPPIPASLAALPSGPPVYALVQFSGPVRHEWQAALEATGAQVMDYLPDYTYVVRLPVGGLAAMAHLPGVRWVGDLLPAYRLDPALWEATGLLTLTVQLFAEEESAAVAQLPGVHLLEEARTRWQTVLRLRADDAVLPALVSLPGVRWIERSVPPRLANDVAAELTGVVTAWVTLELSGTGQTIAVADTGLDLGASGPITDFAGRIVSAHCVGRPSPCQWDDPHGHGTHVAGSAAGSGELSGGQFKGMAHGADLVVQSLYSPTQPYDLYVPSDLSLLFAPAYTDGARIHNNSWGSPGSRYDTWAQTADQFVWDHPDMIIVVAAGNGGIDRGADGLVDPGSLYSPATAKNVMAVGASESLRTGEGYTGTYGDLAGTNFPANPVRDDCISDAPWGLAAFSSRGPAPDGRARPELVAPGSNVVSARSHHPEATYPYPYSADYAFGSGTSQAAPLVSGAAALVRQWYATQGYTTPSAALVRATLVHGAADISPGQYGPAVTGTLVISDDAEGTGVWTSTSWVVTETYGYHSPNNAWVARGTALGFQRLDATVDLSGTTSPLLLFWNRRAISGSAARVYACGSQRVVYNWSDGGRVGWALEGVDVSHCAGNEAALLRFEFQCTAGCTPSSPDVWALDDIVVADEAHLAEVATPPGPGQGWGRLDLATSLQPWGTRWYTDVVPGLQTGEAITFTFTVRQPSVPFRATLVWSDYPASPSAAVALVNDLDMELEAPNGATSYPNGLVSPDQANNIEQIELSDPSPGTYRLVVRGHNVPFGPQPYALAVTLNGEMVRPRVYLPLVVRGSL